ncbi:phosphomannomutase [Desulfovibrio sp. OttesenSCG-928-A18]|nr:phosphomannomutase [Desulfovibrio sp. OttesenSCG-928-A18]
MTRELSCFKAYDIRGRVPAELNLELVRQVGLAFAAEYAPRSVCLGRDMRLSSRDFALVLANALEDGGVNVTDLGLCGTEEVYYATFSQGHDGGIMITASHNPADWNGLKLVREGARPLNSDNGLFAIRDRILAGNLPIAQKRGHTVRQDLRDEYCRFLLSLLGKEGGQNLAPLRIVANAGNGCAWPVLEKLGAFLPCVLIPLHPTPDGSFPNGVPNPLLPEKRADTSAAVLKHRADLGLAWDGDFDRCFFFDEQGDFIESYYLIGLLAKNLLAAQPGARIIHDSRLIWNTRELVLEAGGIPVESKTGHAFMKERMRREVALYGGEMSGHHYFRDFSHCDSGMLVWLLLYKLMSESGRKLSELVGEGMRRYPVSGEINRRVADAAACTEHIRRRYEKAARSVTWVDGLSMDMGQWRFNLRSSNTEPLLRLNVESRGDAGLMQEKCAGILRQIAQFTD